MYFKADIASFSSKLFTLKKVEEATHLHPSEDRNLIAGEQSLSITSIDEEGVHLKFTTVEGVTESLILDYKYYDSYDWIFGQQSGAYVFRPYYQNQRPKMYNSFSHQEVFSGEVIQQIKLFGDKVDTILTLSEGDEFVKIETHLKGIPKTKTGREVVLYLKAENFNNNGVFYTDSMGMEMQERVLNYRQSWNLKVDQPISGNYYPVNHAIALKDGTKIFEVLNDRSQGGSSLEEGEIEIMIQRRTYKDDSRGVHEALNEINHDSTDERGIAVDTTHYFRIYSEESEKSEGRNTKLMQKNIDVPLTYLFGTKPEEASINTERLSMLSSGLDLPENVKVVLLPEENGSLFVRFENILDLFSASEITSINVKSVANFIASSTGAKLDSITEVSNTGLFPLSEMASIKLLWKGVDYTSDPPSYISDLESTSLEPQRIRSFIFAFKPAHLNKSS